MITAFSCGQFVSKSYHGIKWKTTNYMAAQLLCSFQKCPNEILTPVEVTICQNGVLKSNQNMQVLHVGLFKHLWTVCPDTPTWSLCVSSSTNVAMAGWGNSASPSQTTPWWRRLSVWTCLTLKPKCWYLMLFVTKQDSRRNHNLMYC